MSREIASISSSSSFLTPWKRLESIPSISLSSLGRFYRSFQWVHDLGKRFVIQDNTKPSHLPSLPNIQVLSPLVTRILGGNPSSHTLQGTNTYLIGTGKKRILIDTGEGKEVYIQYLKEAMKQIGCEEIEKILISHRHGDHVGGISSIQKEFKSCPFVYKYIYDESKSKSHSLTGQKEEEVVVTQRKVSTPIPSSSSTSTRLQEENMVEGEVEDTKGKNNNKNRTDSNSNSFLPLYDGQKIETEGATLHVCYTPGHTEDHCCFWLEEEASLVSGDCILGHGTAYFEDYIDYMKSLNKLLITATSFGKDNFSRIYPGHGVCLDENPLATINMYIEHRETREKQILATLQENSPKPMTSLAITYGVYGKDLPFVIVVSAQNNVEAQLKKLMTENKVKQIGYMGGFYQLSETFLTSRLRENDEIDKKSNEQLAGEKK